MCVFDFHYETSAGDDKRDRHHFSVVIVTTNLPLKPLVIRQQGIFDRFAALVGLDRIELESAEFNREFHVQSPDRRWAFDVLPQATMDFLAHSPRFLLEFQLCQIIAYRDRLFTTADFAAALQVIGGYSTGCPTISNSNCQESRDEHRNCGPRGGRGLAPLVCAVIQRSGPRPQHLQ